MPPEENSELETTPSTAPGAPEFPAEPSTPSGDDISSGDDYDFSGLDPSEDLDYVEVDDPTLEPKDDLPALSKEPPVAEGEGVTEEGAAEPPKAPEKTKGAEEPAPQAQPVQEPSAPAEPAPATSVPQQPVGLVEQLTQNRDAIVEALATQRFALSKEEEDALELDVLGTVPKLLAKTYYEATMSSLKHLQTHVPQIVQNMLAVSNVAKTVEDQFFGQFSHLDRATHGADIVSFANAFRAANPQISQENLFAMVNASVMAKHGVVPSAPVAPVSASPPPKPTPYVPASPGAPVRLEPIPENPWAGLDPSQDFGD